MKKCNNCNTQLGDEVVFCGNCGTKLDSTNTTSVAQSNPQYYAPNQSHSTDAPNFGYALLGFCIPLVGIILYFVWKNEKPLTAKSLLKGFLVSLILSAIMFVLYFVLIVILGASVAA
ncbi:MAG: zinc-ribbon domain-containing protein [Anaeroplasmataceae bacterium]